MKNFLDKDFLLESETAKKLFHDWAEKNAYLRLPLPFKSAGNL